MRVIIEKSEIHGQGVIANERIYTEVYRQSALTEMIHGVRISPSDQWCFDESTERDDVGFLPYAPYRFLNHSSNPNCEVWTDGSDYYICPLRPIFAGEELTIHYGEEWSDIE